MATEVLGYALWGTFWEARRCSRSQRRVSRLRRARAPRSASPRIRSSQERTTRRPAQRHQPAHRSAKAQGGNNGWTGNVYTSNPDTGTVTNRKVNNKNTVLLWTVGDLEAHDDANLEICFNQPVKKAPDGTILFLNGPWSAINGDTGVKTDYTDRMVLITEQTSTCPEL